MKHASHATLETLRPLLDKVRAFPALTERTPGSFYLRSNGFLHFHEDAAGIFADVKFDLHTFTRVRATTKSEQRTLLTQIAKTLRSPSPHYLRPTAGSG